MTKLLTTTFHLKSQYINTSLLGLEGDVSLHLSMRLPRNFSRKFNQKSPLCNVSSSPNL